MRTVLSIRQPWAHLIVMGAPQATLSGQPTGLHFMKDIENRTWPTKVRGEIYVHASKAKPPEGMLLEIERLYGVRIDRAALQYGGIIGTTRILDCVTRHTSKWFESGGFGFVLTGSRSVPFEPMPGRLGFFKVA